jgi:MFS family permease
VFQAEWGFSPITITVVFGVYALAVLAALLTVGKLSDHIGRRPVLIAALITQIVALTVFATAGDVTALMLARIVQGLSTGAAVGALGAGLLDIDRVKGTVANGVAPVAGTATGHCCPARWCNTCRRPRTSSSWRCWSRSSLRPWPSC